MYRQHIWDSRSQIDHYLPGSPIPRLVTTSSADAWGEEGRKLFRKKQYSQAAECFERAGLDRQKDMAMAYDFRQRAQQHPLDRRSLDLRSGMFLEAAQAFHRLACSTSNKEYFRLAAECFAHSGDYASAAKSYEHSSKYELSARFYRRAEEFDDLVRILDAYGRFMDTAVCDELYTVAKIYYLKTNQRT